MGKTRVGVLLRESIGGNKSTNKSSDLTALTQRYVTFTKKIRSLIEALQAQHNAMLHIEAGRQRVAKQFSSLSKETPLFDCIGLMPSADRPSNTVCSYASVHDDLAAKAKSYAAKYKQFVLDYAVEWEKVIRTRIDAGIKKAEELRIELDHYQKKTEALRLTANQNLARGKSVPSGVQEKLTRNEEKFIASRQNYNQVATDLCILMEEVTERSWRDLHPLLVKVAQFDMTLANDEAKALAPLSQVVASLKQVATAQGLSAQPRLKDLAGLKPELLSTRPGGVAGLAIEAGPSIYGGSLSSPSSFDQTAMPPGSVGPQGMGGFPVPISLTANSNDRFGPQRSNSVSSFHSAPVDYSPTYGEQHPSSFNSNNRLTIQTASAPTMDDMYVGFPSSTRSAPSSGNNSFLPPRPPPPSPGTSWNVRSSSFNDADSSAYSGFNGHPPPPSMPPPPPPPTPPMMPPSYGAAPSPTSYGGGGGGNTMMMVAPSSPWSSSSLSPTSAPGAAVDPMSLYNTPAAPAPPPPQANPNYNPFGY